jgi:dTDP-4-dehydrorhamnose reductase
MPVAKPTFLIFGANGQVGWELQRALAPLGKIHAYTRQQVDIADLSTVQKTIREVKPTVIVNAAAYTAVDKAETDEITARRINADAVSIMATEAKLLGAWLIHYSTDYVFDGSKTGAYIETDPTAPLSVYGQTKLEGEQVITASGCNHLIFRTSWVYASRGNNFAKTMLRLARERPELRVIQDQTGVPTSAELIADVTALALYRLLHDPVLTQTASGIYNLVPSGQTNWHEYACLVLQHAQQQGLALQASPEKVRPIPTSDYPTPARRPLNSRLDTTKLCATFNLHLPDWRHHVLRTLDTLLMA